MDSAKPYHYRSFRAEFCPFLDCFHVSSLCGHLYESDSLYPQCIQLLPELDAGQAKAGRDILEASSLVLAHTVYNENDPAIFG